MKEAERLTSERVAPASIDGSGLSTPLQLAGVRFVDAAWQHACQSGNRTRTSHSKVIHAFAYL
jgi:hypothetical protein